MPTYIIFNLSTTLQESIISLILEVRKQIQNV